MTHRRHTFARHPTARGSELARSTDASSLAPSSPAVERAIHHRGGPGGRRDAAAAAVTIACGTVPRGPRRREASRHRPRPRRNRARRSSRTDAAQYAGFRAGLLRHPAQRCHRGAHEPVAEVPRDRVLSFQHECDGTVRDTGLRRAGRRGRRGSRSEMLVGGRCRRVQDDGGICVGAVDRIRLFGQIRGQPHQIGISRDAIAPTSGASCASDWPKSSP